MHCPSHYLSCYRNFHQSVYLQVDCASSALSIVSFKEDDRCDFDLYYYSSFYTSRILVHLFPLMCRCTQYQMFLFLWQFVSMWSLDVGMQIDTAHGSKVEG